MPSAIAEHGWEGERCYRVVSVLRTKQFALAYAEIESRLFRFSMEGKAGQVLTVFPVAPAVRVVPLLPKSFAFLFKNGLSTCEKVRSFYNH
jgi:hypothetical protein